MKDIDRLHVRDVPGGAVIAVKVVPGASRHKIAGILGDCLKITTAAPPEKGKANQAVAQILAKALGLDRRAVALTSGPTNPRKEFRLTGLSADQVRAALAGI